MYSSLNFFALGFPSLMVVGLGTARLGQTRGATSCNHVHLKNQ